MHTRTILAAAPFALALGLAAFAQPAAAQDLEPFTVYGHRLGPAEEIVSTPVFFGDLNLDSYAGADVMLGRIRMAAKFICGSEPGDPIVRATTWRQCIDRTTFNAVQAFDNPLVAALNDQRMGLYPAAYVQDDVGPGY
jgi:UrcA family protein